MYCSLCIRISTPQGHIVDIKDNVEKEKKNSISLI